MKLLGHSSGRAVSTIVTPEEASLSSRIKLGRYAVVFGFGGFAVWLMFATLSGAVVASGAIVVDSEVKKVQHQTGGIVGQIFVENGKRVNAGDLLVRLDETIPRTTLAQVDSQLNSAIARRARLEAIRDDRDEPRFPVGFATSSEDAAAAAAGERRLLKEERTTRAQEAGQIREKIGQLNQEISGVNAQISSLHNQISLIKRELSGVQSLYAKNLVPLTRLIALERDAAKLEGDVGTSTASIAKSRGQIAELNLQLLTLDQKARSDAVKELREVEGQISQFIEKRIAAQDVLGRIDIRAPQSGFVHEMTVHTIGGVINAGEAIMNIVPDSDRLTVEVKVNPQDIDNVHIGQRAVLRLSAFNQRTTPELIGKVDRVAANVTHETQSNTNYYVVRAGIPDGEIAKLGPLKLIPGMPAEAFIQTGDRPAWSYFAKPLTDALSRSLREE